MFKQVIVMVVDIPTRHFATVIVLAIVAEKLMYKHLLINYPILVTTLAVGLKVRVIVDARLIIRRSTSKFISTM
jgi:flagellar biosynthesis protein FliQ